MIGSGVAWMRKVTIGLAALVVVLAVIGYFVSIPLHHTQRGRLADLVVSTPPTGFGAKAASSAEMTASNNPFAEVAKAAKKAPNSTGAYSVAWNGVLATNSLSLLVTMMPSTAEASTVLTQATQKYLQANSFTSEKFTLVHRFSVPTPAGAAAATYGTSSAKTAIVAYRSGRTVAVIFAQETTASGAEQAASALAASENEHLQKIGSAVALRTTSYPLVASVVFWAVALVLVAGLVGAPILAERARRIQDERHERERRRAFHSSGSKIAKRQAARRR